MKNATGDTAAPLTHKITDDDPVFESLAAQQPNRRNPIAIQRLTGLPLARVQQGLKELESAGLIRRRGGGTGYDIVGAVPADEAEIPGPASAADLPRATTNTGGTEANQPAPLPPQDPPHGPIRARMAIDSIVVDSDILLRDEDEQLTNRYIEAMCQGAEFPPPVVFLDNGAHLLADGRHRLLANRQIGRTEIEAEVRVGGRRDAVLHAISTNVTHGENLSLSSRRTAAARLLADNEWGQWSDREIARRTGLSDKTVARLRAQAPRGDSASSPRKFVSKHGTVGQRKAAANKPMEPVETAASPVGTDNTGTEKARVQHATMTERIDALANLLDEVMAGTDLCAIPGRKLRPLHRKLRQFAAQCEACLGADEDSTGEDM